MGRAKVLVSSLRNKRPDLSGRPPCKGVAIGVARRGGRLGGERTLRVPPCCSFPVSHSGGPRVVSFVAGRRSCACGARVRADVARRAAESVRVSWRGTLPKRFPVARGDSARKLVIGPLGRSGPQVLRRGVGNGLLRTLPLSRGVPASLGGRTRFHGGLTISQARATHVEDNW